MRTEEARQEDINFYIDQLGARIGKVTENRDVDFDDSVTDKEYWETRPSRMKSNNNIPVNNNNAEESDKNEDDTDNDDQDEDIEKVYEERLRKRNKRKKSSDMVSLQVSKKKIIEETAVIAKRFNFSISGQAAIMSNIINSSGGDVNDFTLSRASVWRHGQVAISDAAEDVRDKFENIKEGKLWTCHLDMKAVKEITKGRKQKKERLALIVSSAIPKIDQLLGIPFVERATGAQQRDEVIKLLEEWGLVDQIIAISFDTTSDNTGVDKGSCKLIEDCVGKAILWLACRRHVYELHIKHVATFVADLVSSRLSTNPEETLFKRLRENWSELTEDEDWVDLDGLNKFDWEASKGSFLDVQALEVFSFLQNCLDDSTFLALTTKNFVFFALFGWVDKFPASDSAGQGLATGQGS